MGEAGRIHPYEHRNRYSDPACGARIQALRRVLEREMPPRAEVPGRVLGTY